MLEKILEEIEERRRFRNRLVKYEKTKGTIPDVERNAGGLDELDIIERIIRSHMGDVENNGWIPVSERLPEPYKMVEVTLHCSEWISDYDSDWTPEEEKKYHEEEYIVSTGYMNKYGNWNAIDEEKSVIYCDKEFGTDKNCVYSVVTAWKPLPEPYKGE